MGQEGSHFPNYLVQTLRRFGGSVYIPSINLKHFEITFSSMILEVPIERVHEIETAFADICMYLKTTRDPLEREYYLRLIGLLATQICQLREVEYLTSHTLNLTFEKSGNLISEPLPRLHGTSLRL